MNIQHSNSENSRHNDFAESCVNWASFPRNLVSSRYSRSALDAIGQKMNKEAEDVFNGEDSLLKFTDIYPSGKIPSNSDASQDGALETLKSEVTSQQELRDHLQTGCKDPSFRYV